MRSHSYYSAIQLVVLLLAQGCRTAEDPVSGGSAGERLKPITSTSDHVRSRELVYVPVYSSIQSGLGGNDHVDLGVTLSIRNVSQRYPVILT